MPPWTRSEIEVLRRIVASRTVLANTIYFALETAFPDPEHPYGQNILVALGVPRTDLGLDPSQKPGDIDVLVVPVRGSEILVDRTIAIETKILRPTIDKPSRNVGTFGVTQTKGLLRDGFPFVGLIHISIPEPLPPAFHIEVPVIANKLGPTGELVETGERSKVDPFPLASARRQHGRIIGLDLPSEIGYRVIAMALTSDGEDFRGWSLGESRRGARNPRSSATLTQRVRELVEAARCFAYVQWYGD